MLSLQFPGTFSHVLQYSRSEKIEEELLFCGFETETEAHFTQTEALVLCGGCCSRLDPDALSQDSWALVALQDLQRGGSLLHKYNTGEKHSTLTGLFQDLSQWLTFSGLYWADASEEPSITTGSDITTPLAQGAAYVKYFIVKTFETTFMFKRCVFILADCIQTCFTVCFTSRCARIESKVF